MSKSRGKLQVPLVPELVDTAKAFDSIALELPNMSAAPFTKTLSNTSNSKVMKITTKNTFLQFDEEEDLDFPVVLTRQMSEPVFPKQD